MELTLEHIAEEVWTLKGAYNGISADVKEIKKDVRELYNKTEHDKTELTAKIAETETKLYSKIAETETKLYSKIAETKTELIQWQIGLFIGFTTVIITAIWAILSFAVK